MYSAIWDEICIENSVEVVHEDVERVFNACFVCLWKRSYKKSLKSASLC